MKILYEKGRWVAVRIARNDKKCVINPIQGGGQKRLRAPSSLNFDKNNHRMRL